MLVLSRRLGERIHIGDDVVITVVRIGPLSVRIGIEAPKDVHILRGEIPAKKSVQSMTVFVADPNTNQVIEIDADDLPARDQSPRIAPPVIPGEFSRLAQIVSSVTGADMSAPK